ncbi:flagellar protein FlaG [Bacillus tuaregi]|uniref:flagellar protein FlaG n=1 Tax=Bacillus tuaregi TaxID=1816695 RepID=UPI0008F95BFA|nr:flagellar protein FlaG [Bacillus tuaregi]
MNIERLPNLTNPNPSNASRVKPVEKTQPAQPVEELLKKMDQQQQESKLVEIDKEKMEEVVKGLNEFIQPVSTSIRFELHDKLHDYYVTIVDDKTDEVIREIPSKKLLDTYANMLEFVGLLVDKKI